MAVYNSSSSLKSPILLCSLSMITLNILLVTNGHHAPSFNIPEIGPQHQNVNITIHQDAYISSQGLQVTSDERTNLAGRAGKATYREPLHLWDKASGALADFSTHFSFVIDSYESLIYADGIAFFLAPNGSNVTDGRAMGLPVDLKTIQPTSPFVAVEFDTHWNWESDPVNVNNGTHVGININSIVSNVSAVWESNITDGMENEAWIKYDSNSKNLTVVFTGWRNNARVESGFHLLVDLRDCGLPEWVEFGFSASTGLYFEKNNVKSWQFHSSALQIVEPGSDPLTPTPKKRRAKNMGLVVGLIVGSCALVGGLALVGFGLWKRSRGKEEEEFGIVMSMENEFEMGSGPKKFSYGQLFRATNNFSEEQKLGEGGFGGVYRGFLRDLNSYVAVKRISKGSKQGIKEYASEVRIISRLRHRNLVQLIGWCHEKKELLLVYEFMENGSLDSHLFKGKTMLTWAMRCKIAQGLASALLYLHEEWEQCVVHRDVKSSNVMLDSNFNAKLGDFGLARLVDHEKGSQTTVLAGTMGYLAPECVVTGKASKETDVYSFGVVALEIACGRKPFDLKVQESQMRMVEWVWDLYGTGKLLEAADPKLSIDFDAKEMECLMVVGLWCAHPDHALRPSIRQAIQVLNFEAPLPILPAKLPALTFFSAPVNSPTSLISLVPGTTISNTSSSYYYNTDSSKLTSSSAASSPSASCLHTK
ncbi:L-type lectin-domain containing receptor kinase IX.1-like [Actinidia eriantha]|uniref:L-type lectin-domain containing receptor kinase IX.1-like n=1 Tax=Actinidia eriantha TaxID=165200 RepID=UPI002582D9C1|nr:L-type lectin-domain containing receptor kinase IX.1-like [Actinidia eriantha]